MQRGIAENWVISNDSTQVLFGSTDLEKLQEANAQVVRIDFRLGTKTSWDSQLVQNYTTVLTMLASANIPIIGILGPGILANNGGGQSAWNQNNKENGGSGSNSFVNQYTAAVKTVVSAFPQVIVWEVWNEPNDWASHSGTVYTGNSYIYPSILAAILNKVYPAIKAIRPGATVITGGLLAHNNGGQATPDNCGATYLKALYNAGAWWNVPDPFDGIGQHYYICQNGALDPAVLGQYLDWLCEVISWAEGLFQSTPTVWITELGWQTGAPAGQTPPVSEDQQAANIAAALAQFRQHPWIQAALNFELKDNPGGSQWYGLYRSDWSAKPSLTSFAQS